MRGVDVDFQCVGLLGEQRLGQVDRVEPALVLVGVVPLAGEREGARPVEPRREQAAAADVDEVERRVDREFVGSVGTHDVQRDRRIGRPAPLLREHAQRAVVPVHLELVGDLARDVDAPALLELARRIADVDVGDQGLLLEIGVGQIEVRIPCSDEDRVVRDVDQRRHAVERDAIDLLDVVRVGDVEGDDPGGVLPVGGVVAPVVRAPLRDGVEDVADHARVGDLAVDGQGAHALGGRRIGHVGDEHLAAVEAVRIGLGIVLPVLEVVARDDVGAAVTHVHLDGDRLEGEAAADLEIVGLAHVDDDEATVAVEHEEVVTLELEEVTLDDLAGRIRGRLGVGWRRHVGGRRRHGAARGVIERRLAGRAARARVHRAGAGREQLVVVGGHELGRAGLREDVGVDAGAAESLLRNDGNEGLHGSLRASGEQNEHERSE